MRKISLHIITRGGITEGSQEVTECAQCYAIVMVANLAKHLQAHERSILNP